MQERRYQLSTFSKTIDLPKLWGAFVFAVIIAGFIWFALWSARGMSANFQLGDNLPIELDISHLIYYTIRTTSRMFIALLISLIFTFVFGTLAAKNRHAENFIIPAIDVLQSLPVLSFVAVSVVGFLKLFPNSLLGPECAAIFAVFTSQAWNMTFSLYQSLKMVPKDLQDAARVLHLNSWQRYWRVEVPFAVPSLLWNMMMSMSAGWFFVVASEVIIVSMDLNPITLPGVGSYIYMAIENTDLTSIYYAIGAMFCVILAYDQLFFRPLICWSEKFKPASDEFVDLQKNWFIKFLHKTHVSQAFISAWHAVKSPIINFFIKRREAIAEKPPRDFTKLQNSAVIVWYSFLACLVVVACVYLWNFVVKRVDLHEVLDVFYYGLLTATRVTVLIILSSCLWVPVGVWIGKRPKLANFMQPVIQFIAAFPANLLFPLVVYFIVTHKLNAEVWTTPLMILGAQWYILFNVIAGASVIPHDLYQVTRSFNIRGWLWWKQFIIPGIFPYYITGVITAAGGAWNASIVAEAVTWGGETLPVTGLGAYIAEYATKGDLHRLALGVSVMCLYVIVLNKIMWRPLYKYAEERCQINY